MRIDLALLLCLALPTSAFADTWPGHVCKPQYITDARVASLLYQGTEAYFSTVAGIGGAAFEVVCSVPYDETHPPTGVTVGYRLADFSMLASLFCNVAVVSLSGATLAHGTAGVAAATPRTPRQGAFNVSWSPIAAGTPAVLNIGCLMSAAAISSLTVD